MQRLPSVKTLREVFADQAPQARKILEMSRAQLLELPAGAARAAECFNPPKTYDIRMHCLNAIASTHGIEAAENADGEYMDYLNAGDPYAVTLLYWRGSYRVACWGDIAENPRNKFRD